VAFRGRTDHLFEPCPSARESCSIWPCPASLNSEEDISEGFEKRKQLAGLLVESISLGKSQQVGRAEVQITYRFGPPSDAESDDSFMPGLKNGSRS
jgi:hypothetical protein